MSKVYKLICVSILITLFSLTGNLGAEGIFVGFGDTGSTGINFTEILWGDPNGISNNQNEVGVTGNDWECDKKRKGYP